jgi:hypothetical protein
VGIIVTSAGGKKLAWKRAKVRRKIQVNDPNTVVNKRWLPITATRQMRYFLASSSKDSVPTGEDLTGNSLGNSAAHSAMVKELKNEMSI